MKMRVLSKTARIEASAERQEQELVKRFGFNSWVDGFAWLPVRIDPKTVIWLEKYQRRLIGTDRRTVYIDGRLPAVRVLPIFERRAISKE